MNTIDFLPASYRQRHAERHAAPWHLVILVVFALLVGAAAVAQSRSWRKAESDLSAIRPLHEQTLQQQQSLTAIQTELQTIRTAAELHTLLRSPWLRTQLVTALLRPLPDGIQFDQLQISREARAMGAEQRQRSEKEESDLQKLPAAERELKKLRDDLNRTRTVIRIQGTTRQPAALHEYLADLAKSDLLLKAELDSFEAVEAKDGGAAKFRATVIVRPGYGQTGGPTAPPKPVVAEEDRST